MKSILKTIWYGLVFFLAAYATVLVSSNTYFAYLKTTSRFIYFDVIPKNELQWSAWWKPLAIGLRSRARATRERLDPKERLVPSYEAKDWPPHAVVFYSPHWSQEKFNVIPGSGSWFSSSGVGHGFWMTNRPRRFLICLWLPMDSLELVIGPDRGGYKLQELWGYRDAKSAPLGSLSASQSKTMFDEHERVFGDEYPLGFDPANFANESWDQHDAEWALFLGLWAVPFGVLVCWFRLIRRVLFGASHMASRGIHESTKQLGKASRAFDKKLDDLDK